MTELRLVPYFILLCLPCAIVLGQTNVYYTAYRSSFAVVTTCDRNQYYDIALLQCSPCPMNAIQKIGDWTQCECNETNYYYAVNQGGGAVLCQLCPTGNVRSSDDFGCVATGTGCPTPSLTSVTAESGLSGLTYVTSASNSQPRVGSAACESCVSGTLSDQSSQRCSPCARLTPYTNTPPPTITCCDATTILDGICLRYVRNSTTTFSSLSYLNRYTSPSESKFFRERLEASLYLCRMNLNSSIAQSSSRLLLVNATACHVLANIAAMQFYYPADGYAYNLYDTYIWQSTSQQIWSPTSTRPSIPFLAYPSTYYSEISNASYNWIPAVFQQNNVIRIKLAKYSPTGQYLGLFDAVDSYMHLCGRAYTDGRPAFTFGTIYNRTCSIRVDTLWNSAMYETAFFDPYIQFTQSSAERLIPIPVVIKNYQTRDASPNQNADPSQWVYHRRFFLLDRVSGLTTNSELKAIHYAKSIKIRHRLTSGTSYMQPPVIIIEYAELTQSDLRRDASVQITFQTEYLMDLNTHIRDIWIAIGVLSGLGIVLAFIQTRIWYSRAGKQVIDLATIGKLFLSLCNIIATVFFIVMAGVSMWWLIFYKREDFVYFIIPTSAQQATFTTLVIVAFVLKTLDVLQLIIRQGSVDIFFIDWEKPKDRDTSSVSIWRSCFIANEFNELQTFRRISLTFQLVFLLLLLKVINLENIAAAQPGTNLFPSTADYQADYNGILRVGIAFSMWLATGLIQYLVYVVFYQRLVENRLVNFIDLCSVSNVSVFILQNNHYGYYIHGRSPHGVSDVNMKEMMMHLARESDQLIGRRGLEANSDDQTFIVKVSREFRLQFDILLNNYQNRIINRMSKKEEDHESDILLASYRNLNEFLCAFITRSLPTYPYTIRRRLWWERIFNREFQKGVLKDSSDSRFFTDPDQNFSRVLFIGHENSLFIWNMATFLLVDYFAFNYVLAAIITYILNLIAVKLRLSLGRRNISKKTLIAKNFLI